METNINNVNNIYFFLSSYPCITNKVYLCNCSWVGQLLIFILGRQKRVRIRRWLVGLNKTEVSPIE